ncbi:MAG: prepilin-type N-terminal cleavage/methylation domain-containing protein [Phycisphaerae bacterium]
MVLKNKKAFTLVELLVVISLIGLLVGILLPCLAAARERGRNVVCRSNLKNIGLALRMYLDVSGGRMFSSEPYPGSYGQKSQHWFMNQMFVKNLGLEVVSDANSEIIGTGKGRTVLTCPTHKRPDMTRDDPDYPTEERDFSLSYMANGTLGVSGRANMPTDYRNESEYKKPARAMMFCDGNGTSQISGVVLFDGCPVANFEYRHKNKTNTLFLDQHIESLTEDDVPFCSRFNKARLGEFWYAKQK